MKASLTRVGLLEKLSYCHIQRILYSFGRSLDVWIDVCGYKLGMLSISMLELTCQNRIWREFDVT